MWPQALLERLLSEQRENAERENSGLKAQLTSETAMRHTSDAELSRLRGETEARDKAQQAEIAKLREELKKLTSKPKPKPVRSKGALSGLDLDEGPDAPPIAEQLATALRANSTRVLDLFRSWDIDGDGQVSRAEFHKAMPALGLEVAKQVIDDLFTEWDADGGGQIGYAELRRILQAPRTSGSKEQGRANSPTNKAPVASAGAAMKALGKLKKK